MSLGYITVPLYDSFGLEVLEYIVKQVKMSVVFVDAIDKQVKTMQEVVKALGNANTIKTLIFPDSLSDAQRVEAEKTGLKIFTVGELAKKGEEFTDNAALLVPQDTDHEKAATVM